MRRLVLSDSHGRIVATGRQPEEVPDVREKIPLFATQESTAV